ncbi:MAG: hypothetical protein AB7U41_01770 [Dongiaceae bacterium]
MSVKKTKKPRAPKSAMLISVDSAPTPEAKQLIIRVLRGDLMEDDKGRLKSPTIAQRLAAAQLLLKWQEKKTETPESKAAGGIDLPPRSETFGEWLERGRQMQALLKGNSLKEGSA